MAKIKVRKKHIENEEILFFLGISYQEKDFHCRPDQTQLKCKKIV
jgi:hypothetical protein